VVASVFAIVAGLQDARLGRPPYLWAVLTAPAHRASLIKEAWTGIGKVFLVAVLLDLIYQIIVLEVYPGEALIVAALLAIASCYRAGYCFARRRHSARRNSGKRQR
jgi:hypothetical protein